MVEPQLQNENASTSLATNSQTLHFPAASSCTSDLEVTQTTQITHNVLKTLLIIGATAECVIPVQQNSASLKASHRSMSSTKHAAQHLP